MQRGQERAHRYALWPRPNRAWRYMMLMFIFSLCQACICMLISLTNTHNVPHVWCNCGVECAAPSGQMWFLRSNLLRIFFIWNASKGLFGEDARQRNAAHHKGCVKLCMNYVQLRTCIDEPLMKYVVFNVIFHYLSIIGEKIVHCIWTPVFALVSKYWRWSSCCHGNSLR